MGKTSYRQDTSPSLSFQRGGIMCTIVSANIFVKNRKENTEKKGKKMPYDIMVLGDKKGGESCCS